MSVCPKPTPNQTPPPSPTSTLITITGRRAAVESLTSKHTQLPFIYLPLPYACKILFGGNDSGDEQTFPNRPQQIHFQTALPVILRTTDARTSVSGRGGRCRRRVAFFFCLTAGQTGY